MHQCERCGFMFDIEARHGRCPKCQWRHLKDVNGETDDKIVEEEVEYRKHWIPDGVMFDLRVSDRKLVKAIVGPGYCLTYEGRSGQKHTLWEGEHSDLEVWAYWVHPNPLLQRKSDELVSVILIFEYEAHGVTRHSVEVFGAKYPTLACWTM